MTSADIYASSTAGTVSAPGNPLPTGFSFASSLGGSLYCAAGSFCTTWSGSGPGGGAMTPVTLTLTIAPGTTAQTLSFYVNLNGESTS